MRKTAQGESRRVGVRAVTKGTVRAMRVTRAAEGATTTSRGCTATLEETRRRWERSDEDAPERGRSAAACRTKRLEAIMQKLRGRGHATQTQTATMPQQLGAADCRPSGGQGGAESAEPQAPRGVKRPAAAAARAGSGKRPRDGISERGEGSGVLGKRSEREAERAPPAKAARGCSVSGRTKRERGGGGLGLPTPKRILRGAAGPVLHQQL